MTTFHTPERQERHARLIDAWKQRRDSSALEALLADYQPLFQGQIMATLRGRTLSPDHKADLLQECTFALLKAVEGYDPQKCPSIAPYLVRHVRGALRHYVLNFRTACRLGSGSDERAAYYAAQRLRVQRLTQGQDGLTEKDVACVARDTATSMSVARRAVMAMGAGSVDIATVADTCEAEDTGARVVEQRSMVAAMAAFERHVQTLPERTRIIVCETLLGHRVEGAITRLAERYQISPRRVRQIQEEGLAHLRDLMVRESITADAVF